MSQNKSTPQRPPIAVVGASALFPGSIDGTGFWRDLLEGNDLISDVPASHWLVEDYYDADPAAPDKTYAKRGAFLKDVDFDALGWGVPPNIVPATDTAQLLALIVAQRVLHDATQGRFKEMDRSRTSVILGVTSAQELLASMVSRLQKPVWVKALREAGLPESQVQDVCQRISDEYVPWQESTFPGVLGNVVAGRIANRLDLGGTNCVTDAACASTFSALSMAVNELYLGQSDMVITGGVDTMNDIFMYMCFSKTPALSASGDCRPFSDKADGTMLGEGLGMVALKRLDDAERDGDKVYAVIRGVGSSSDGRSKSVYAPVSEGQAKSLRRAYEAAGFSPSTVELVEAHGTGTKAGDAAEFEGLRMVFEESGRQDRQWCNLGSVKSQIGHTKAAAGAAGLFKSVMALHHKVLPPTIKVDRPNPKLKMPASPFGLNTRARPWVRDSAHPRRASVSAFGFGGSNFHLALEEYTGTATRPARLRARRPELVTLCATTAPALLTVIEAAASSSEPGHLAWLARSSQASFDAGAAHRLAFVCEDEAALAAHLKEAASLITSKPDTGFSTPKGLHYSVGKAEGKMAFVFPGQGSQKLDMGADLAMHFDAARAVWDAAASLPAFEPEGLHEVVFPRSVFDDEARAEQLQYLTKTEWAQPAIGAVSASMMRLLQQMGVKPDCAAGHSFGEVSALFAAGVLSEADLLKVARRRGALMAAASAIPGAMTAVSTDVDTAKQVLEQTGSSVVVANHNSPTQVVLSGDTKAIEALETELSQRKLRFTRLQVGTAFHSPVVAEASEPFAGFLAEVDFKPATMPVYSNSAAAPYPTDADAQRTRLAEQIRSPVRFVEQIEAMYEAGVRTFVEVGPGSALSNLIGRILKGRPHRAIEFDRKGKGGLQSFFEGLARLAVSGQSIDFDALWAEYDSPENPAERVKPKLAMPLNGANYGKPYPPKDGAKGLPAPNPERVEPEPKVVEKIVEKIVHVPVAAANGAGQPAQPAVAPVQPAVAPVAQDAWLQTFQAAQQQTAEAHAAYQRAMADAHASFLKSAETGFMGLSTMMATPGLPAAMPAPTMMAAPVVVPQPPVIAPQAAVPAPELAPVTAQPVRVPVEVPAPAPVITPLPVAEPAASPAAPALDLQALLLDVVADKTGYPAEMLSVQMDLEGDLGVDSIKRVEILSAMRERAPSLPEVDASAMANLRTLGEIIEYMGAALPAGEVATSVTAAPVAAASAPSLDLEALLMDVVADKTGYPSDMLSAEMDLEGDLGVDSIKRVEILSAMRERAPELPEVDAGAMASLRTLGEIIEYMGAALPAGGVATSAPAAPVAAPSAPSLDLEALLMEVVADKTGYPSDMLSAEMDLEGDLGVDSIKRVEILSAMRERAPELPEVDAGAMASLRTLGEIIEYMGAELPAAEPAAASAAPSLDLEALLMEVVADKTGYPSDMLSAEMDLEGDLGVDSIKRVEILSAMRERAPELPEVDAGAMASLRTLGEIIEYMGGAAGQAGAAEQQAPAQSLAAPAAPELGRFVLDVLPTPAPGLVQGNLRTAARVMVTDDGGEFAIALAAGLVAQGVSAEVVSEVPQDAEAVIFTGGVQVVPSSAAAVAINHKAFAVAKAVAASMTERGGSFVVLQSTGGDFGLSNDDEAAAHLGGLAGLAKTAAQEWPKANVRAIDVAMGERSAAQLADAVVEELLHGGTELEVGLRADGQRVTLSSRAEAVQADAVQLDDTSVVLVSGGARGVTAATVIRLAEETKSRFVLMGRSRLEDEPACCKGAEDDAALKRALLADAKATGTKVTPAALGQAARRILAGREVRGTLDAIQKAGGVARYVAVDICDSAAVAAATSDARAEWGAISAIVHGAGVVHDKLIADKPRDAFDRVFDTKVKGLDALLAATAQDNLKAILLFSSVSGRCGNVGQSDYAMANEVLNKRAIVEQRRRGEACRVRSLGWGPWAGGMVTPELEAMFSARGVPLIPLATGAQMLVDELSTVSAGHVEVVLGGEPKPEALLRTGEAREHAFEVTVARRKQPYLDGHAIDGVPVVPVVLALEWFARAASAHRPDLQLASIENLKVLSGIRLVDFEVGAQLQVVSEQISNGDGCQLSLRLVGAEGRRHYSATARMVLSRDAAPSMQSKPSLEDWGQRAVYGDVLFHGPAFQVIESVHGVSDHGMSAQLTGVNAAKWSADRWRTDPAAFDGGLQLALLWSQHVLGGASLPTEIEAVHTYFDRPSEGSVQCVLHRKETQSQYAVSDISFVDGTGQLIAQLNGVKTHLRPASKA